MHRRGEHIAPPWEPLVSTPSVTRSAQVPTLSPFACHVSSYSDEQSFWSYKAQQEHVTSWPVTPPFAGGPRLDTSYRPVRMPLGKLVQSRPPYSGVLPPGMGSMMGIDPSYKPAVYRQQPPVSQGQILRQQLQAKLVSQSCALFLLDRTVQPRLLAGAIPSSQNSPTLYLFLPWKDTVSCVYSSGAALCLPTALWALLSEVHWGICGCWALRGAHPGCGLVGMLVAYLSQVRVRPKSLASARCAAAL